MFRLYLLLSVFVTLPVTPLPVRAQDMVPDPADIILRAIRGVEAGDSSAVAQWRETLDAGNGWPDGSPEEYPLLQTPEARQAALGLAATAWITYRHQEAVAWLDRLLDPSAASDPSAVSDSSVAAGASNAPVPSASSDPSAGSDTPAALDASAASDPVIPYAWLLRGEVAAARARLAEADSAFGVAEGLARERESHRPRAWALIRRANVRGRLTGDPATSAALLSRAEPLLRAEDEFLRGQFHCVRAGNDPSGAWTAESDARAGMELAEGAGIRRLYAACLHVLASDQLRRGRTNEALNTFWEEQEVQRAIGDRSGRAATLQWAGYLLFTSGDFAASRAYLLEAVEEGEASGNLSPVAWAYLSLSGIAVGLGDLAGGIEYLDRAQELLEAQGDRWGLATLEGRRAAVAFAAGDWDTARAVWEKTLAEHRQAGNVVGALSSQTGLLELALAADDLEAAEAILGEARQLARDAAMGPWETSFLFHEAEVALKRKDPGRTMRALDGFLLPGQHSIRTYRAQVRYAEALAMEGRLPEAADRLEEALEALESWRERLDAVGLQRYAFQIGEYLPDPDLGVASILADLAQGGMAERAFDLAERQRARLLFEKMILAEIVRSREVSEPGGLSSVPLAPRPLGAAEVREAIPDSSTALVEFVTGDGGEPTSAFILTRDEIGFVALPPADSLEREMGLLRSLAESGGNISPLAARLGRSLLQPVVDALPRSVSRLILVPGGPLHQLPFDLLEVAPGFPLMERFALALAPSTSVFTRLVQTSNAPPSAFLVLGDPRLPDPAPALPRLPGASREARAVAGFGHPSSLLLGPEASETAFREGLSMNPGVVHMATHALMDESSLAATYLLLAPDDGNDGFVNPGEIARLSLPSSLVVLSGCRTAGGPVVRGEGVQGLTAPFLQAGARAVMATQWPMEDRAGLRMIRDFYQALALGREVGQAMQASKLAARERGDPPSVWAAFTLVGDPTVRIPAIQPSWWQAAPWEMEGARWPLLVVLLGLLGWIGFRLVRRRPV